MSGLSAKQDAFGRGLYDLYRGLGEQGMIIERDDGFVDIDSAKGYFADYADWSPMERQVVALARGRVLDVGCGAGRVALYLQRRGLDVLGIDNSPLAVKVCRLRELRKVRLADVGDFVAPDASVDTIVLFGSNFGLLANPVKARRLLCRFHRMTSLAGRIVAQSRDPYKTHCAAHRAYHVRNRRRGRMGGQVRIRVRHESRATPWFDYLFVSQDEMARIVTGTGWRISRITESPGPGYTAVLEKEQLTGE